MKRKKYNGIYIESYDNVNFQRNGISGESFYSMTIRTKEDGKYDNLLVTFQTTENDSHAIISTCRAVSLNNLNQCYRGDEIARAMNQMFDDLRNGFDKSKLDKVYDFVVACRNFNELEKSQ